MLDKVFAYGRIIAIAAVVFITLFWLMRQLRKRMLIDVADDLGTSFILKTKNSAKAFKIYMDLKERKSSNGMIISRVFPERLRTKHGVDDSVFLWLSREEIAESIDPSDLEKLEFLVYDFVSSHKNAIVLLDGIEYITTHNTFEDTLKFLQSLNDHIILNKATLIIPLDPASLDKKELSLLERELEIYQIDYRLMQFFE
jgi:hypothetical protein